MYRIKEDQRSIQSAQLISEGLAMVLKKKDYPDISISEVCKINGIARTTFYRHFDTLDDVLMYQYDQLFQQSIRNYADNSYEPVSFARLLLQIATENPTLTTAIIKSDRRELLVAATRSNEKLIMDLLQIQLSNKDLSYLTTLLTYIAYATLKEWVEHGCQESLDELYELMKREVKFIANQF